MISRDPSVANASSLYATKSQVEAPQAIRYTNGDFGPATSDKGKLIQIDKSSTATTISISDSALSLSAGERIDFVWTGTTPSVIFLSSGVTLNATPGLKLRARYSAATLLCIGTNSYVLIGDLSA
jgi:plastocyanin